MIEVENLTRYYGTRCAINNLSFQLEKGDVDGFLGPNGAASRVAAQHSQNFASWYSQIPGLKVVFPFSASGVQAGEFTAALMKPQPNLFKPRLK